jgi:hypothetical protein
MTEHGSPKDPERSGDEHAEKDPPLTKALTQLLQKLK